MTCPKCKQKNPDTAVYCEFCYERFKGHSAAATYQEAMRRVRAQENGGELPKDIPIDDQHPTESQATAPAGPTISFSTLAKRGLRAFASVLVRFWRPLGVLALGLLLLFIVEDSLNPVIRFHYFGTRLTYAFPGKRQPATYIFGSIINATRWSERAGQMDTPLGNLKLQDLATVHAQGVSDGNHGMNVAVTSTNWLLTIQREKGSESRLLSAHPGFLGPAHFWVDRRGQIVRLQQGSSIRIAKSVSFVAPVFPQQRLHEKMTWSDKTQWSDDLDGWTVDWTVRRQWRVDGATNCEGDLCLQLHYDALLAPRITNEPAWMSGATWHVQPVQGIGDMVFNATRHAVVSHHLEYAITLRAAISDLRQIPKPMRVGRRAFHAPGEIILDLKNSVSLQRN